MNSIGFEDWSQKVLSRAKFLAPKTQILYSDNGNLFHYSAVAEYLYSSFKSKWVEQAGYLHGMQYDEVVEKLKDLVSYEVLGILRGLDQINALKPEEIATEKAIPLNLISSLDNYEALYVFLIENLHHIDPGFKLLDWTRSFIYNTEHFSKDRLQVTFLSETISNENAENYCLLLAEVAEHLELWVERNCIRNALLLFTNPTLFRKIVNHCLTESGQDGQCQKMIRAVRQVLSKSMSSGVLSVHWEWRHVAGMSEKLPLSDNRPWGRFIYQCGYVTVACKSEVDCYNALHHLHRKFGFRANNIKFYNKREKKVGEYKAIHTQLKTPDDNVFVSQTIPVRLLVDNYAYHYRSMSSNQIAEAGIMTSTMSGAAGSIKTYTPDGKQVGLPLGGTVLNFAHILHNSNVAKVVGATINGKPTDNIFTTLSNGDVVFLKLNEESGFLPDDWRERIPADTVGEVSESYKKYFRNGLRQIGKRYLVQKIQSYGLNVSLSTKSLHNIIKDVDKYLRDKSCKHPPGNKESWWEERSVWWVQQFGIYIAVEVQNRKIPHKLIIDKTTREMFLAKFKELVDLVHFDLVRDLDLPEKIMAKVRDFRHCELCCPSIEEELVGTINGKLLVLHKPENDCSESGFEVTRKMRVSKLECFHLKTKTRTGIATDILKVFSDNNAEVSEIVGRKVQNKLGVFRLTTDYLGNENIKQLELQLKEIPGVDWVYLPHEKPEPKLERVLPPKWNYNSFEKPHSPYTLGQVIRSDVRFYGMDKQMELLKESFKTIIAEENVRGMTCFVCGPKRVGKSSLTLNFNRSIELEYDGCLVIEWEFPLHHSWSEVKELFFDLLREKVKSHLSHKRSYSTDIEGKSGINLIRYIIKHVDDPIVIALDEFIGLAFSSARKEEGFELAKFIHELRKIPRCLLILVGPNAYINNHSRAIQQILSKSKWIEVPPLGRHAARKLMEGDKLRGNHNISFHEEIFNALYQYTNGNPFWLNLVAFEMWQNTSTDRYVVSLKDPSVMNYAISTVLRKQVPFRDRANYEDELSKKILCLAINDFKIDEFSVNDVINFLSWSEEEYSCSSIKSVLDDMAAVGTLKRMVELGENKWAISSPMLLEYIDEYVDCGGAV